MVNIAILNLKDITKYIGVLCLVLTVYIGATKYLDKIEDVGLDLHYSFIKCIDQTLPVITEADEEIYNQSSNISISKLLLQSELKVPEEKSEVLAVATDVGDSQSEEFEDKEEQEVSENVNSTEENIEKAETGLTTEVVDESGINTKYTNTYKTVQIKNESKYNLTEEMLDPSDIKIDKKDILIFHTHTCESYTPSDNYQYEASGTFRTTNLERSVAKVGDVLTNALQGYGYKVTHDTTYHDYPAYTGSYGRSLKTVQTILQTNPNTEIVFDLHRDAVGSNSNYAPTVKIGDEYAAQIMFVIGTDGGGLQHPNWNQNLKFAIKIQEKANELYPGLFKPIILRNSRYNQHVTDKASIIEVGATGNTMEQCITSMKYLAKVIDEVIK